MLTFSYLKHQQTPISTETTLSDTLLIPQHTPKSLRYRSMHTMHTTTDIVCCPVVLHQPVTTNLRKLLVMWWIYALLSIELNELKVLCSCTKTEMRSIFDRAHDTSLAVIDPRSMLLRLPTKRQIHVAECDTYKLMYLIHTQHSNHTASTHISV